MPKCKNCNNLYNLSNKDDVIVGKWCPKINDSPHLDMERDCKHYKAMTNADRIRSMTDEEFPEDETRKRVVWHENGWCTNEPGCDDYEKLDDFDSENFEVIGNVFDNPELLEG